MADSTIRQRLADSAESVLAEEFSKHRDRLCRMIDFRLDRMLARRVDSEDILQESWLVAAKRIEYFLSSETLSMFVWLRLIVAQTIVDVHRRHLGAKIRDTFRERSIHDGVSSQAKSAAIAANLIGSATSPSQALARDEQASKLREVIDSMEEVDRDVMVLRHFEQLTNAEVAEELGIKETAASNRYVRAMKRLGAVLRDLPDFADPSS